MAFTYARADVRRSSERSSRARMDIIIVKAGGRGLRFYVAIRCGSKQPWRARGRSISIAPVSVATVLRPYARTRHGNPESPVGRSNVELAIQNGVDRRGRCPQNRYRRRPEIQGAIRIS